MVRERANRMVKDKKKSNFSDFKTLPRDGLIYKIDLE